MAISTYQSPSFSKLCSSFYGDSLGLVIVFLKMFCITTASAHFPVQNFVRGRGDGRGKVRGKGLDTGG